MLTIQEERIAEAGDDTGSQYVMGLGSARGWYVWCRCLFMAHPEVRRPGDPVYRLKSRQTQQVMRWLHNLRSLGRRLNMILSNEVRFDSMYPISRTSFNAF